jgi:hypothetical protein
MPDREIDLRKRQKQHFLNPAKKKKTFSASHDENHLM